MAGADKSDLVVAGDGGKIASIIGVNLCMDSENNTLLTLQICSGDLSFLDFSVRQRDSILAYTT